MNTRTHRTRRSTITSIRIYIQTVPSRTPEPLYLRYIWTTSDFDSNSDPVWIFPSWSHILIALFTVGIHKGGVDNDEINARMAPDNRALAELTVKQLENWDNQLQLIEQKGYEPYEASDGWRPDHINL